ncbi:hypothetical protein CDAR_18451 [Caerostris darwini]|uniref:PilZ domain-containing protein n=1 Tax=Caerostris darwini TaxID=1538125 RepID=A0AAV4V993_9ARAC|nr:hypothetical protein CDAR_18451 [Caerostris darwini]
MRQRVTAKQIMEVGSDRSFSQFQRRNPRRGTSNRRQRTEPGFRIRVENYSARGASIQFCPLSKVPLFGLGLWNWLKDFSLSTPDRGHYVRYPQSLVLD